MRTRRATTADVPGISALIYQLSYHFLANAESAQAKAFYDVTDAIRMAEYIAETNRLFVVAHDGLELAGFISLKDGSRISQFFVSPKHQSKGLGRRLWSEVRTLAGTQETVVFTVDSSRSAAPVYERLGFKPIGPVTEQGGVVFVPMRREAGQDDVSQETPSN